MFLLNSRHGSFTAPQVKLGDPFFRSYGASVPSSLTRFLSRALVFLYYSTCVGFGTDTVSIPRSFSRRLDSDGIANKFAFTRSSVLCERDLPRSRPAYLDGNPITRVVLPSVGSIGQTLTVVREY